MRFFTLRNAAIIRNMASGLHTIRNGVPTPEEMGEFLGISSERVSAVRSIMESPVRSKPSSKASSHRQTARRYAAKKVAAKKAAKR